MAELSPHSHASELQQDGHLPHPRSYYVGVATRFPELCTGETVGGLNLDGQELATIQSISETEVAQFRDALEAAVGEVFPYGI